MRWANREGRIERVKLAELSSCCLLSGGLPCLCQSVEGLGYVSIMFSYLTRSPKVNGWRGLAANLAMSPSVTFSVLSGDFCGLSDVVWNLDLCSLAAVHLELSLDVRIAHYLLSKCCVRKDTDIWRTSMS